MKQIFTLLLFVALTLSSMAQLPNVRVGNLSKGLDGIQSAAAKVASHQGNEIVMATYSTKSFLGSPFGIGLQAVVTDTNLNVLRQVDIPNTGQLSEVLYANVVDGHLYILHRNMIVYNYSRTDIDLSNMTVVKNENITANYDTPDQLPAFYLGMTYNPGGANEDYISHYCKSENGDFYGIVSVTLNTTTNETSQVQILLDNKFEKLWTKQYKVKMLDDIMVDNDGVMYLLGSTHNENTHRSMVSLSTLDVDGDQTIEDYYNEGMISSLKLINAKNGTVIAAGPVYHEITRKESTYDKVIALAINTRERSMTMKTRDFTAEETCIFNDKRISKNSQLDYPQYIEPTHALPTDNGGIVLLQSKWRVHHTDTKQTTNYYMNHICGTLMVAVDANGNISWAKPFRTKYSSQTGTPYSPVLIDDVVLKQANSNIYFFQQELAESKPDYNLEQNLKALNTLSKHNWGIYCITPNGDVTKSVVKGSTNGTFNGPLFPLGGNNYFTLFSSTKKSSPVYVHF